MAPERPWLHFYQGKGQTEPPRPRSGNFCCFLLFFHAKTTHGAPMGRPWAPMGAHGAPMGRPLGPMGPHGVPRGSPWASRAQNIYFH